MLCQSTKKIQQYKKQEKVELPLLHSFPPKALQLVFLGFNNIYEDYLHIWLLQKLINKNLKTQDINIINKQILSVVELKPKIESLYSISCFVLTFDLYRPDLCESIIKKGMEALPESWLIPMLQGYISAFKLKDPIKASFYYHQAGSKIKSPSYPKKLAKKILSQGLTEEDHKKALEWLIKQPNNKDFQSFFKKELGLLRGKKEGK